MKDKRKKKDRTWADAARLALEKHPNTPMTAKQILEVIQKEGLKETSGTSPLACLNAMLHTNSRVGDRTFFKIPGKSGLYALKKESGSLVDGVSEPVCEYDLERIEMTETNNCNGDENGASAIQRLEEESSDVHCTIPALQSKSVSSTQQYTKKALRQALRQHHKRRNGMSMMVSKAVPRVVLTPLKVSDDQPDSPTGSENKNRDNSEKGMKQNNRSYTGQQISQHLKKLKKSGLGYLKWTKAEDIDIETPGSILVNTNLRALINKHTFASLPQHFQQYLLHLLPDVDRQMGTDGVARLCNSALNNEFFAYAAQGWKQRLAEGEFTPEMQLRIRQEMEKERKTEMWKEKYYEDYYGQKSGFAEKESQSLVPSVAGDAEVPPFEGTAISADNTELKITENICTCEEEHKQSDLNVDDGSNVSSQLPSEDIEVSEFPEISEESVVQEEIAEEVESSSCTYLDYTDVQIQDTIENVTNVCTEQGEINTQPLNKLTAVLQPPLETSIQLSPEINKPGCNETDTLTASPQSDSSSIDETPSISESKIDKIIQEKAEESPDREFLQAEDNVIMDPMVLQMSSGTNIDKDEQSGVSMGCHILHTCDNREEVVSEIVQSTTQDTLQPEGSVLSNKENYLPRTSFKMELEQKSELGALFAVHMVTTNDGKDTSSYTDQDSQLTSNSYKKTVCLNDEMMKTFPDSGKECQANDAQINQHTTRELEEATSENYHNEIQFFHSPKAICASPLTKKSITTFDQCNGNVGCSNNIPESPFDEVTSETSQNINDFCEPAPQTKDPKQEQKHPDTQLTKHVVESTFKEDHVESIELTNSKGTESSSDVSIPQRSLREFNISKETPCDLVPEKTVLIPATLDMLKVKLHKSYPGKNQPSIQDMRHRKHVEVIKAVLSDCSDGIDTENSKRKPAELHSGTCREKRARTECNESSRTSSPVGGKEPPPREELRVPPLKIQLSKAGLPFIVKTNSIPKSESKLPSPGRNLGARTLADIKARAHQARAQREAAAAAAMAAAAHITAGEGGPSAEGSKTRSLAHVKEQNKAKMFTKHYSRPQVQHHSKGIKEQNEKKDHQATDQQESVQMPRDCSTGVIIANPNRRSPAESINPIPSTNSKTLETKTVVTQSITSISVPNSVCCFPVHQMSSSVSHARLTNTEDTVVKESALLNIQVPVSTQSSSTLSSSHSVLVSICNSNQQTSVLMVPPSKISAKTTISSSAQRAVLPKYEHELSSSISEKIGFRSTDTKPYSSIGNDSWNYRGQISHSSTRDSGARLSCNVSCYPQESSTLFSHAKPNIKYTDHHAYTGNGVKLQHFGDTQKENSVCEKEVVKSEVIKTYTNCEPAAQNEMQKGRQLQIEDSGTNKAIPCKVIVDHSSALYQSAPAVPENQHNPPMKGVKTETVLRLQESIMSRAESFRLKVEQNGIFNPASRENSKSVHVRYGVLQNLPLSQQVTYKDADQGGGAANLIYSSLLHKHAEKVITVEQDADSKSWRKQNTMETLVIQKNNQKCNVTCDVKESTVEKFPSQIFPNTRDFREPFNLQHHLTPQYLDDRQPMDITSNNCSVQNAENGIPASGGSNSHLSSVEANNPLVTQLLQGNLPLEKVLPQPRPGDRLEVRGLPLSYTTNSMCKTLAPERTATQHARSSIGPKAGGLSLSTMGQNYPKKLAAHPSSRVLSSLSKLDVFKAEVGKPALDSDNRRFSCLFGANLNQLDAGQKLSQEWSSKAMRQGNVDSCLEIKQSKRLAPSCRLQKQISAIDKNCSFLSDSESYQQQFCPPLTADRDSRLLNATLQTGRTNTVGCVIPNKLMFHKNQEQNGQESMAVDNFTKGSFPSNLQNMQPDLFHSNSQSSQSQPSVRITNSGKEVKSVQKQAAGVIETNSNLNWLNSESIHSRIKVEPMSFDENVSNSCEISIEQTPYEQHDWKINMQAKASKILPFISPEKQKVYTQKSPDPHQQVYSNCSSIHFSNGKFSRTASVIEKSVGNHRTQVTPMSSNKYANIKGVDELQLKCSCRLKAMIMCKGCGAFCHDDCIGPSELCVACLVVR